MPDPISPHQFPEDFVNKMERGEFDGRLTEEFKKLTPEQLEDIARVLAEREETKKLRDPK